VTVGFHRYFTHRSFKAKRGMRIALAIAGSMALQGPIMHWVADHRRHHAFSDREGDPHSAVGVRDLATGGDAGILARPHGLDLRPGADQPGAVRPDLLEDNDIRRVHRQFGLWTAVTMALPAALGGLITWSWWGAITAFFWAGLVRVSFLHHVTWSGELDLPHDRQPAVPGQGPIGELLAAGHSEHGESWHNLHTPTHLRPARRRPRTDRHLGPVDWLFERFGWVTDVRWPRRGGWPNCPRRNDDRGASPRLWAAGRRVVHRRFVVQHAVELGWPAVEVQCRPDRPEPGCLPTRVGLRAARP